MLNSARSTALADNPGAPMQRLADQLSGLTPPHAAAEFAQARPSPAVEAAIKRSAQLAALAAKRAQRERNRTFAGSVVESFVSACSFVPYALVALILRVVVARVFFINGQAMIDGPRVPISIPDLISLANLKFNVGFSTAINTSVVLPFEVKASTFDMFLTHYATVPMPSTLAAYLASYGAFILPVMLVLGLGTRFAALGLLIMTAMINLVMPEAFWTSHAYWAAMLLVLLSRGAGEISFDHIARTMSHR
ncbi:MAG: DoxX family protein [Pseudolabrys sp.]|nr:DoxX family protein [Pseudolabrys sp.]